MRRASTLAVVTSAYHFWLAGDGTELEIVAANKSKLTAAGVANIGRSYSIMRTLPRSSAELVAKKINVLAERTMASDLCEVASACVETALEISGLVPPVLDQKKKPGAPYSAVSKLLWFARPTGWTMYDRYASAGLGARGIGVIRFRDFYLRLATSNFFETLEQLRGRLATHKLPVFLAERIVDYELMHRGSRPTNHPLDQWVDALLRVLDPDISPRLRALAADCAPILAGFATEKN